MRATASPARPGISGWPGTAQPATPGSSSGATRRTTVRTARRPRSKRCYDLHAGLVIGAGQRERLEQVCRYVLRPPVASDRLEATTDGEVRLQLGRPWRDGTTALVFSPLELLARLAVLVPRPRVNLLLYYGVLGARSAWRRRLATAVHGSAQDGPMPAGTCDANGPSITRPRAKAWAALMQRTFGLDVLACPRCGGRLRLVALVEHAAVVARILDHLGLPATVPLPRPPPNRSASPTFSMD